MKSAMTLNNKAILSSKGQVVIPKALREQFGMHAGNELIFEPRPDGVIELRTVKRNIEMFFGRCKETPGASMTIQEMDDAIMQAVSDEDNKKG